MCRMLMGILGLAVVLSAPASVLAAMAPVQQRQTVTVHVDGETEHAREMFRKLQARGAKRGVTVMESADGYDLRILVLARGPQWRNVIGVAASGAVAVLGPYGDLLFMDIRQKEATEGGAMDRLVDSILERLPALLRGERLL